MNSRQLQTQVEGPRVSSDERDVLRLIASAARRARAIFVAEVVAWAAVAAAAAFALTALNGAAGATRVATMDNGCRIGVHIDGRETRRMNLGGVDIEVVDAVLERRIAVAADFGVA